MRIICSFLADRRPDPACLALRHQPFREAMQHGIDPAARWVVQLAIVAPLEQLLQRLTAESKRGEIMAAASLPVVAELTPVTAEMSGLLRWARARPETLDAVLVAISVSTWLDDHQREIARKARRAMMAARVKLRALATLAASCLP